MPNMLSLPSSGQFSSTVTLLSFADKHPYTCAARMAAFVELRIGIKYSTHIHEPSTKYFEPRLERQV